MWFSFFDIWLMDDLNWIWHLCACCEFLELGLGYYCCDYPINLVRIRIASNKPILIQEINNNVIIGLFEAINTSGVAFTKLVKSLLVEFWLTNKILTCVKDEDMNLASLNFVSFDVFEFKKPSLTHVLNMWCPRFASMPQMKK